MGRVTQVWYAKGERPRGRLQQERASVHLFGAVCPERDTGLALALPAVSTAAMSLFLAELGRALPPDIHAALVLPEVSTAAMGVFLAELSRAVPAGTHAALVLDGAGWHLSPDLAVPPNLP